MSGGDAPAKAPTAGADSPAAARIRKKLDAFLSGVPIGTPGPKGSTSARTFDVAPLVRFAVEERDDTAQLASDAVSAEDIYSLYVEWQMQQGERQLSAPQHKDEDSGARAKETTTEAEQQVDAGARPL